MVIVYDSVSGKAFNSTTMEVRPVVPASTYESMLKNGATAFQQIDVPVKGGFFLRIGVHDVTTDHVGALEIPTASIKSDPVQR
jgi:hypothetical protein